MQSQRRNIGNCGALQCQVFVCLFVCLFFVIPLFLVSFGCEAGINQIKQNTLVLKKTQYTHTKLPTAKRRFLAPQFLKTQFQNDLIILNTFFTNKRCKSCTIPFAPFSPVVTLHHSAVSLSELGLYCLPVSERHFSSFSPDPLTILLVGSNPALELKSTQKGVLLL